MSFDEAFEIVLAEEGGYVNDPKDSGGETNMGISKRAFPDVDIKSLTKETVKPFYRKYWDAVSGDLLPDELRLPVFDFGFNAGAKTSIRTLQRTAGVKDDGVVGKVTLQAIKSVSAMEFHKARIDYYIRLANKRKKDQRFLKGWIARSLRITNKAIG